MGKKGCIISSIVLLLVFSILFMVWIYSNNKVNENNNLTLAYPSIKIEQKNRNLIILWSKEDPDGFNCSKFYSKLNFNGSILENERKFPNVPSKIKGIHFCFDSIGNIHLVGIERFGEPGDYPGPTGEQYSFIYYLKMSEGEQIEVPLKQLTNDRVLCVGLNIAVNNKDNIQIIYLSDRDSNFDIYYFKLNNNGEILVKNKQLTKNQDINGRPFMLIDENDNIHITWENSKDRILYYMKINDTGSIIINQTPLMNLTKILGYPIVTDNEGQFLFLRDYGICDSMNFTHIISTNAEFYQKYPIIHYTKIDSSGSKLIENKTLIEYPEGYISNINVEKDSDNNIHVVWIYKYQIHYMKINNNGTVLIPDMKIAPQESKQTSKSIPAFDSINLIALLVVIANVIALHRMRK